MASVVGLDFLSSAGLALRIFQDDLEGGPGRLLVTSWDQATHVLGNGRFDGILWRRAVGGPVHGDEAGLFAEAYCLLRPGGIFTYTASHTTSLPAEHVVLLRRAGFAAIDYDLCGMDQPADGSGRPSGRPSSRGPSRAASR
jgi:hypothetical protein